MLLTYAQHGAAWWRDCLCASRDGRRCASLSCRPPSPAPQPPPLIQLLLFNTCWGQALGTGGKIQPEQEEGGNADGCSPAGSYLARCLLPPARAGPAAPSAAPEPPPSRHHWLLHPPTGRRPRGFSGQRHRWSSGHQPWGSPGRKALSLSGTSHEAPGPSSQPRRPCSGASAQVGTWENAPQHS